MDNQQEQIKKSYELGFVVKLEDDVSIIKDILNKYNAEVVKEGIINKIRLAYPIKKNNYGFFGYIIFNLEPEKINDIVNDLKFKENVIRTILIKNPTELKINRYKQQKTTLPAKSEKESTVLTNKDLEKKIEEILK
ncbi:MAG: 30S ribosomal protein S6 [Minisyncoccia bacterium]